MSLSSNSKTRTGTSDCRYGLAAIPCPRRRLIQHSPEHTQILDRFEEGIEVDGLHHERVHTQLIASQQVTLFARRGQHDDWDLALLRIALDALENLQAVEPWQFQIKQNDCRIALSSLHVL